METVQFFITSFPYLQEITACGYVNEIFDDDMLFFISKSCPHLKKLFLWSLKGVTDQGIEFLYSPQSVTKELVELWVSGTNVTATGAERALTNLTRLEFLECTNDDDIFYLLKSLSEQELVVVGFKEMSIFLTDDSEEIYNCDNLFPKLPQIFPNLRSLEITVRFDKETQCLLHLRSLPKLENLRVRLVETNISMSFFPCDNCNDHTNFFPKMNNLTELLINNCNICVQYLCNATPCLQSLTIVDVTDLGCTHSSDETGMINSSVVHLSLTNAGNAESETKSVMQKFLGLCPSIRTLELELRLSEDDEMQFMMNLENLKNLTHLSLPGMHMETAVCLTTNCEKLQVLNLTYQSPSSEEAMWLENHIARVLHCSTARGVAWFEHEKISCCLCQAYESNDPESNA